jgi:hypothetical protein
LARHRDSRISAGLIDRVRGAGVQTLDARAGIGLKFA